VRALRMIYVERPIEMFLRRTLRSIARTERGSAANGRGFRYK
jgi:hypothetical protein